MPTVSAEDNSSLVNGTDYTVSYSDGDYTNVTGENLTVTITGIGKYKGTYPVSYQIIKCPVTLKSASLEKVYDGTALVNGDTALETEEGWAEGEGATYSFTGTQTNAGSSKNAFTYTLKDNTKEGNYSITKKEGTLTVTKQSIVPDPEHPETYKGITISDPKDKVYNGKDQTWVPEVKDANGNALDASCYTVTYDKDDRTNVTGKINVTIKGAKDYKGEVTKTYQIIKCPVTLKSASLEKVYDGTALVNGDTALETEEGWAEGEGATYSFTGTQTNAGSSKNAFTYTLKDNTKEGNYSITKKEGTLTVTPKSIVPDGPDTPEEKKTGITVTKPSDSKYDGEEHKNKPTVTDTKTDKVLVEGKDYELSYSKDVTNAGTVTVTVTGKGNYEESFEVTYQITKRPVTLKSADLEKVYDGTALVNGDTALETEEGWAEGEGATYSFTGTQTNAGSSKNAFTYTLKDNTKEGNYSITKKEGTLTVTPKSIVPDGPDTPEEKKTGITVTKPSDSKYDGEEHKNKPTVTDTKTDKVLVEGKDYELSYSKDVTNAGTVTVTVTGKGNYEESFEVTYQIIKRSVTLTSADATKTYDGKALTNTSITVSGDGFVEGEGAEYKVTGTQTEVGNSANSFEYKLNENTLASNYDITKVVGTLTVTAAPAPETPEKPAKPRKVKTGLQTNTGILMIAGTLALAGLGVCVVLARRKRY